MSNLVKTVFVEENTATGGTVRVSQAGSPFKAGGLERPRIGPS